MLLSFCNSSDWWVHRVKTKLYYPNLWHQSVWRSDNLVDRPSKRTCNNWCFNWNEDWTTLRVSIVFHNLLILLYSISSSTYQVTLCHCESHSRGSTFACLYQKCMFIRSPRAQYYGQKGSLVSQETMVLRRWESETNIMFHHMKRVAKGWITSTKMFLVVIQPLSTRLIKYNFYGQKAWGRVNRNWL